MKPYREPATKAGIVTGIGVIAIRAVMPIKISQPSRILESSLLKLQVLEYVH